MALSGRVKAPRDIAVSRLDPGVLNALARTSAEWYEVSVERKSLEVRLGGEPVVIEPAVKSTVLLRLGRDQSGHLICNGLVLGLNPDEQHLLDLAATEGHEVQARDLRKLPLAEILSEIADWIATDPDAAKVFGLELKAFQPVKVRPGPKGHSEEHFKNVWATYQFAIASGQKAPVKWLRERLNQGKPEREWVSDVTVRRWLRVGRNRFERAPNQKDKKEKEE